MDDRIRIGTRIKEIRKKKGVSQENLAGLTGLKQANISRIESGRYNTGIDALSKIGSVIGATLDFIEEEKTEEKALEYKLIGSIRENGRVRKDVMWNHPVYEKNDRYFIFLEGEPRKEISYYKDTLKPFIQFLE